MKKPTRKFASGGLAEGLVGGIQAGAALRQGMDANARANRTAGAVSQDANAIAKKKKLAMEATAPPTAVGGTPDETALRKGGRVARKGKR